MAAGSLTLTIGSQPLSPYSPIPGLKSSDWTTLFDETSTQVFSQTIEPNNAGLLFMAFGLQTGETIAIQAVVGPNSGDLFQNIVTKSVPLVLSLNQTLLFLPTPCRCRAVYNFTGVSRLSQFQVYIQPVDMANFSAMMPFFPTV